MEVQRNTARAARKVTNYMGADVTVYESIDPSVTSEFVGYDRTQTTSKIPVLTTETELVEALSDGEVGTVIVEQTPFYATMGGQQGDKGIIRTASGTFEVEDTIPLLGGKIGHIGKMTGGMIKNGDEAELIVNARLRAKNLPQPRFGDPSAPEGAARGARHACRAAGSSSDVSAAF